MSKQYQVVKGSLVSEVIEDYLVTIYRLEEIFGYAKTTHIAKELGVKPATVSKIIDKLQMKGLIEKEKYQGTYLTKKGRNLAEKIIRKHRILEVFLSKYLNFGTYETHKLAHQLEHMPDELIERIHKKLGYPSLCPHGNIIPGSPRQHQLSNTLCLTDVIEGKCYKVVRIAGELSSVIHELSKLGIDIGTKLKITNTRGSYYEVLVLDTNKNVMLDDFMLKSIYVKEIKCGK